MSNDSGWVRSDARDIRVRMGLIIDIIPRAGVELRGVAKSFRTRRGVVQAVGGIDVALPAGETVALLGPNGAGKSTTIDMILGLVRPDRGTVSTLGRRPRKAVEDGLVGALQDDPAGLPGDGGCTGDVFFNSGTGNTGLLSSGNVNTVVANSGSNDVGFAVGATRP